MLRFFSSLNPNLTLEEKVSEEIDTSRNMYCVYSKQILPTICHLLAMYIDREDYSDKQKKK